jgi:hypothetical protein
VLHARAGTVGGLGARLHVFDPHLAPADGRAQRQEDRRGEHAPAHDRRIERHEPIRDRPRGRGAEQRLGQEADQEQHGDHAAADDDRAAISLAQQNHGDAAEEADEAGGNDVGEARVERDGAGNVAQLETDQHDRQHCHDEGGQPRLFRHRAVVERTRVRRHR